MKRIRTSFLSAGRSRAFSEAVLLYIGWLLVLYFNKEEIPDRITGQGILFISVVIALWSALRLQLGPEASGKRFLYELSNAFIIDILVSGLSLVFFSVLHWRPSLGLAFLGKYDAYFIALACGPFLGIFRAGIALIQSWNDLRRRHFHWAVTHAFLMVIISVISCFTVYFTYQALRSEQAGRFVAETPAVNVIARILTTIFPSATVFMIIIIAFCIVSLPPLGLFSYLVSRHLTRRIRTLSGASEALRKGDYSARVETSGEDEVAQLQRNFNAMAAELSRTLRELRTEWNRVSDLLDSRRQWFARISHELRTPLATLRAHLESAFGPGAGERMKSPDNLTTMMQEISRLDMLIDDLFVLAQKEAGGLNLNIVPVQIDKAGTMIIESLKPLARQLGQVELVPEFPPGISPVLADEQRLEQILINLIRNAIRHTPPGGIVALAAENEGGFVRMNVRDTGEGIKPEDLPHIWESFYRSRETESGNVSGAGLGLALVKELTEAMGGSVNVKSVPGQGSDFIIRIPKA